MPPYGLYSLADTPEELLSGGYRNTNNIPFLNLSDFEKNLAINYDPAFGRLVTDIRYQPAPFTGAMPFQRMFDLSPSYYDGSNLGFRGDLDIPSFGGVSGYRDTGGIMNIEPAVKSVDKLQRFQAVEDNDLEASAIPEFAEGQLKQSSGILDLIGMFIPGFNILRNFEGQPYQQFSPGTTIRDGIVSVAGVNTPYSMFGGDFYNEKTGLNRFDRAAERYKRTGSVKDLFASSRTGAEFFSKLRERKAAKQKALEDAAKAKRDIKQFTGGGGGDGPQIQDRPATTGQGLTTSQFQAFRN